MLDVFDMLCNISVTLKFLMETLCLVIIVKFHFLQFLKKDIKCWTFQEKVKLFSTNGAR